MGRCNLTSNGTIIGAQGDKNNCGKFKSNASGSVSNVLFTNMKLGSTFVDAGFKFYFSNISFDSGTDLSTTLIDGLGSTNFDANTNGVGGANLSLFDGWSCATLLKLIQKNSFFW